MKEAWKWLKEALEKLRKRLSSALSSLNGWYDVIFGRIMSEYKQYGYGLVGEDGKTLGEIYEDYGNAELAAKVRGLQSDSKVTVVVLEYKVK